MPDTTDRTSSGWDSPPPQIVQLRGLLADLIIAPAGNPLTKMDEQLELCVALVDRLIEQYPELTAAALEPFVCPRCGRKSHNEHDMTHGYCGACHEYTREPAP